jgi:TfoX/Sxy family transcriptional regulator of competence genes
MPPDPGLVARVADALSGIGERTIRQKNVFGGRGFLAGKSTFVIVWDDDLIVKAPPDEYAGLVGAAGVEPFAPDGERAMSTWLVVRGEVVADDPELVDWVRRGLRAVRAR